MATKDRKYGVINIQNEIIVPPEYYEIDIFSGVIVIKKRIGDNTYQTSVLDLRGKTLIPFKEDVFHKEGNAGALMMKDKTGTYMIDKKGNKVDE